jgi:hypothetical protein
MFTAVVEVGPMMRRAIAVGAEVVETQLQVFHTWCRRILLDQEVFHTLHSRLQVW